MKLFQHVWVIRDLERAACETDHKISPHIKLSLNQMGLCGHMTTEGTHAERKGWKGITDFFLKTSSEKPPFLW